MEFNKRGGVGAIGVTANVAAKLASDFQKACISNAKRAVDLDKILQPLHSSLFIESNPSPVKYAASLLGMCKPTVRLPLVEIRDETKKVSEALKVAKLLNETKITTCQKIICFNRKASFNYFFLELLEAGISLKGSEVKSLRDGKGSIADSML